MGGNDPETGLWLPERAFDSFVTSLCLQELVTDQAVRHLKQYTGLFAAFSQNARSELSLLLKVQEFCYSNMTFMRAFQKIIMLFYKTDIISEQVILKWYKQDYNVKGKMMFVDQMKVFVDWLQNAEEESDSEGSSE